MWLFERIIWSGSHHDNDELAIADTLQEYAEEINRLKWLKQQCEEEWDKHWKLSGINDDLKFYEKAIKKHRESIKKKTHINM